MSAPNSPVSTAPCRSRHSAHSCSKSTRPVSGGAAELKLARIPRSVSAASVNCGTSSKRAARICQGAVHLPFFVGKQAVAQDPFRHAPGLSRFVILVKTDQGEDPGPYGRHGAPVDVDAGLGCALQQGDHGCLMGGK